MARAVNQIRQDIKAVDLVIELLDARVPLSSCNPAFAKIIGDKAHTILLHKADRADDDLTAGWLSYFHEQGKDSLPFSVFEKKYLKMFFAHIEKNTMKIKSLPFKRSLRLMIVGIPNVGKSTFINLVAKRNVARTGNQPGVTRGKQWIRIAPGADLLDTAGILPKNTIHEQVFPLAAVGALPRGQFDLESTALWLIEQYRLYSKYDLLVKRYGKAESDTPRVILEQVGLAHGCIGAGRSIDYERAAAVIIKDFQAGLLGRITLEKPPDTGANL